MKMYSQKLENGSFEIIRSNSAKAGYDLLPEQYTIADMPYILVTESDVVDPETGDVRIIRNYNVDAAAKAVDEGERTKVNSIAEKYKLLNDDVFSQMYTVFRTNRSDSASANYETFKDMKQNPGNYSALGLKVDHQVDDSAGVELFNIGSALDTDQKVIDYATRKVEQALAYGAFRSSRIQQFKDEKEAINNS